jgi:hypothetical protein
LQCKYFYRAAILIWFLGFVCKLCPARWWPYWFGFVSFLKPSSTLWRMPVAGRIGLVWVQPFKMPLTYGGRIGLALSG